MRMFGRLRSNASAIAVGTVTAALVGGMLPAVAHDADGGGHDGFAHKANVAYRAKDLANQCRGCVENRHLASGAVSTAKVQNGTLKPADLSFDPATQEELDGHNHDADYAAVGHSHDDTFWKLAGNPGTDPDGAGDEFLGTTDNQPLNLRVNNERVARFEPDSTSPSVILGHVANDVSTAGATIGGGGSAASPNKVTDDFGTVGGGRGNAAGDGTSSDRSDATVGGGLGNTASGLRATVAGGRSNTASGVESAVGGGFDNAASGNQATVGGGWVNLITGATSGATIGGGVDNTARGNWATVAGGHSNTVFGLASTVGGGDGNVASNTHGTVGGGVANWAQAIQATVGGGESNTASGIEATVGGGRLNHARSTNATVGGGLDNTASGIEATVGGGDANIAGGERATVGGGGNNDASGDGATVSGGDDNTASNTDATVGGGLNNEASGSEATVGGGFVNSAVGFRAAVGGGEYNTVHGQFATIPGGSMGRAPLYGQMAHASGGFLTVGDAQTSVYVLRNLTTDATQTELFLDGGGARLTLADGRTYSFEALIVARSDTGESAGYRITGLIERVGATTALIGFPTVTVLGEDQAAWDATVEADDVNDALVVKVTGEAAKNIRWVANVRTSEVAWPPAA